jgi:homopolymeric O-antigen transport system ATP-binding protein
MKPIITLDNVGKQYKIRSAGATYETFRDVLTEWTIGRLRRQRQRKLSHETFWALSQVNLHVTPGEVLGIIGRNGAGKSTLLKLISRITEPTTGRIELYGRVGSLLEVGTGFHPELTGRENVYLSGAILGMTRTEINRKFDEIVSFSEIERFIDVPVKWYSSGMYVRLAFSVAAHVEPEILILDEVLSVGDASFQMKCFNKLEAIRKDGRTILFVSHNMQSVLRLCKRVIYLSEGTVVADGQPSEVASQYVTSRLRSSAEQTWDDIDNAPGDEVARLRAVRVRAEDGTITDVIDVRQPVTVEMEYQILAGGDSLAPNMHFFNEDGVYLFVTGDRSTQRKEIGWYTSTVRVPGNFLAEGTISVNVALSSPLAIRINEPNVVTFQVIDTLEGDSARGDYTGPMPGVIRPLLNWNTTFTPANAKPVCALEDVTV